jgi:hypothetical protein
MTTAREGLEAKASNGEQVTIKRAKVLGGP